MIQRCDDGWLLRHGRSDQRRLGVPRGGRRDLVLGGLTGIVVAASWTAMSLIVVAGTVARLTPSGVALAASVADPFGLSFRWAVFYGIGGVPGAVILIFFGLAALAPPAIRSGFLAQILSITGPGFASRTGRGSAAPSRCSCWPRRVSIGRSDLQRDGRCVLSDRGGDVRRLGETERRMVRVSARRQPARNHCVRSGWAIALSLNRSMSRIPDPPPGRCRLRLSDSRPRSPLTGCWLGSDGTAFRRAEPAGHRPWRR